LVAKTGGTADYTLGYGYDGKGRLNQVLGPGLDGTNGVRRGITGQVRFS
jgi:hypothetical protein